MRWYLRFKLSFQDLAEMMAERGLQLARTSIMRWVRHYVPEVERRWNSFGRPAGHRGEWIYLYRAIDREGRTVDSDVAAGAMWRQPRSFSARPSEGNTRRRV
jgi:transposase-like protein